MENGKCTPVIESIVFGNQIAGLGNQGETSQIHSQFAKLITN
jgi:hypothetical protein